MACYRLTYRNRQAFCVEIDATTIPHGAGAVYAGVVYRVDWDQDVREAEPLQRADGQPVIIYSVTDQSVLATALGVLAMVSGAPLDRFLKCCDGPYLQHLQKFG